MNFEQLAKLILNNSNKIFSNNLLKRKIKIFIKNYFSILNLKIKKLKLGLVTFEIKQFFFGNIFLYDNLEMRYSRQDTTAEDELKLENQLNAIKWKWDFQNIGAFLIITIFVWFFMKNYFDIVIKDLFYSFYDTEKFEVLTCYSLKTAFDLKSFTIFSSFFLKANDLFTHTLLKTFIYFKLF